MKCAKCGNPLAEGDRFCGVCGAEIFMPVQQRDPQIDDTSGSLDASTRSIDRETIRNEKEQFDPQRGKNKDVTEGRRLRCINCGTEIEPDASYCVTCGLAYIISKDGDLEREGEHGTELVEACCPHCDQEIKSITDACPNCGKPLLRLTKPIQGTESGGKLICPICGEAQTPERRVCWNCGVVFAKMPDAERRHYCKYCGNAIADEGDVCAECSKKRPEKKRKLTAQERANLEAEKLQAQKEEQEAERRASEVRLIELKRENSVISVGPLIIGLALTILAFVFCLAFPIAESKLLYSKEEINLFTMETGAPRFLRWIWVGGAILFPAIYLVVHDNRWYRLLFAGGGCLMIMSSIVLSLVVFINKEVNLKLLQLTFAGWACVFLGFSGAMIFFIVGYKAKEKAKQLKEARAKMPTKEKL